MENKSGFVIYSDSEAHIDLLNNEEAGMVFKMLFKLHNALNNGNSNIEIESEDRAVKMAFNQIKNYLIRDLKKYKDTSKKRAIAGKLGGTNKALNNNTKKQEEKQIKGKTVIIDGEEFKEVVL